jgi:hypothetical protein
MSNIFNLRLGWPMHKTIWTGTTRLGLWRACLGLSLLGGLAGCGDPDVLQVRLHSRTPSGQPLVHLEVTAQVSGQQAGLRYKWFSVSGGCNQQESDRPATSFKFADGATRDRISVEVWRDGKLVGRNGLDVRLDEIATRLAVDPPPEDLKIHITSVPSYEPKGGPDTRGEIGGTVAGNVAPGYSVVLYARASEFWYIQTTAYAEHSFRPDYTWTTWTHTGSSYAALVVRPGFEPVPRLDVLPKVGGYVVARAIVEGARAPDAPQSHPQ